MPQCFTATSKPMKKGWIICLGLGRPGQNGRIYVICASGLQTGNHKIRERCASPVEDLKMIAVSRILLDNFDHIKAYWVSLGVEMLPIALQFGADDVDGTIGEENVMHAAGILSPGYMTEESLKNLIVAAERIPVEETLCGTSFPSEGISRVHPNFCQMSGSREASVESLVAAGFSLRL